MALSPILVELRASSSEFMAKMREARAEVGKLDTESAGHFQRLATVGKYATLAVAGGVVAIGVESVKMAGEFQQSTSVLQTAAGETAEGLKVVRKGILDIAASTGTSWQSLTEGMYQVEKAGYRGAEGLKVLKAAAQGAAEENADLGVVTNAMTSVMASYHISADRSVSVMNALKTAAAGSKDTMQNFAGSLSTVLPIASAAGLGFDQVGGAIAGLTRHGTSAMEATQELANTIRNLQAPSKQAVKELEQFGISSTDLSRNLGTRGLGGTLEYLVETISSKMGPSGLVMLDTFKKSKSASADLATMMAAMSPATRRLANDFLSNTISLKDYRKEANKLPTDQLVMARQFAVLAVKAGGFSDALRSGMPAATTMSNELKKMLGGSTGLNTALMLTGENSAYVAEMTKRTGESLRDGGKDVEGWALQQKNLNQQLKQMHQAVSVAAVKIGTDLIPVVSSAISWMGKHKGVVEGLAAVIGVVLVTAIGAYLKTLAVSTAETVAKLALQVAAWVGYESSVLAAEGSVLVAFGEMVAAGAAWFAEQAVGWATIAVQMTVALAGMVAEAMVWAAGMVVAGAMALLPFLPLIAAVAAVAFAAYELYKHWNTVWHGITAVVGYVWGFIKKHAAFIVGAIFLLMPPLGLLIAAVHQVWVHWHQVWGAITAATRAAWSWLSTIFHAIVGVGLALIHKGMRDLQLIWSASWATIKAAVSAVWSWLSPILSAIVNTGLHAIQSAAQALSSAWSSVWSAVKSAVSDAYDFIKPILDTISKTLGKVGGAISSVGGALGSLSHAGGGAISGIGHMLGFADGGWVPGAPGEPRLAVVHGGEFVLSHAMLTGSAGRSGALPAGVSASPRGGAAPVVVHSHVYLDGRELHGSVQTEARRYLARNGRSGF